MDFYGYLAQKAKDDGIDKIVVGAIVLNKAGEILIVRRPLDEFMGGLEELPSGNIEPNEPLDKALLREVKEETNLDIRSILSYINYFDYKSSSGKNSRQYNFAVTVECDENVVLTEHDEYKWQTIDEALENTKISEKTHRTIQIFDFNKKSLTAALFDFFKLGDDLLGRFNDAE